MAILSALASNILRGVLFVGGAGAIIWAGHSVYSAIGELHTLRTTVAEQNVTIEQMRQDRQNIEEALAQRTSDYLSAKQESEQRQERFKEVYRNDKTVKSWADTPVPDSVLGLFK